MGTIMGRRLYSDADLTYPDEHPVTTSHRLTLDYPVSLNQLYRTNHTGSFYKTPKAKAYAELARQQAVVGWRDKNGPIDPLAKPVVVYIDFYRAVPPKPIDLDNGLKIMLDALNGVCWIDDNIIESLHLQRHSFDGGKPRVEIEIALL